MYKKVLTIKIAERRAEKRAKRLARTFIESDKSVKAQMVRLFMDVEVFTERTGRHSPLYSDLLNEFVYRTPKKFEVAKIKLLFKDYAMEMIQREFDVSYVL